MENKTKVWYNPAIIELRRNGQRRIERALKLVATYSDEHSEMPYLPSVLRTRFEIWAGSPSTSFCEVFEALERCLVWHKELFQPSDDDIQKAISRQLSQSATESDIVIVPEKSRIEKGLRRITFALRRLDKSIPGTTDRYIGLTSPAFRRKAALWASDSSIKMQRIVVWILGCLARPNQKFSIPGSDARATAVKEAAKHATRNKTRKESVHPQVRKVRDHILPHEERSEDYVNGVKYRVIIYFGRNVK